MLSRTRLILLILLALFLVTASVVGFGVYYVFSGPSVPVEKYLPTSTVALAYVPNAASSGVRIYSSRFLKVVSDKNAQDLGTLIAGLIIGGAGGPEVSPEMQKELEQLGEKLGPAMSGESFIAITGLNPHAARMIDITRGPAFNPEQFVAGHLIAGLKPKQGPSAYDAFEQHIRERWERDKPEGIEMGTGTVEGQPYEYLVESRNASNPNCRFLRLKLDGWVLFSLGEAPMADFIKRYRGTSGLAPSLAENPHFVEVKQHLDPSADAVTYVGMAEIAKTVKAAVTDPTHAQLAGLALDWTPAMGMSATVDNGMISDRYYYIMPEERRIDLGQFYAPCAYETLRATHPQHTLFYMAQAIDLKALAARLPQLARQAGATGEAADPVRQIAKTVALTGLDLEKNILDAVGHEIAAFSETGAEMEVGIPFLLSLKFQRPISGMLITLKDPAAFEPTAALVINILKAFVGSGEHRETVSNGYELTTLQGRISLRDYGLPVPPSMTVTYEVSIISKGPMFGIITSRETALRVLSTPKGAQTFMDGPNYAPLKGMNTSGSSGMIYLNTPQLVNTYYPVIAKQARSAISMIAAQYGANIVLPDKLDFFENATAWVSTIKVGKTGLEMTSLSGVGNQGVVVYPVLAVLGGVAVSKLYVPPTADDASAPAIVVLKDLQAVRRAIKTWGIARNPRSGTVPKWTDIQPFIDDPDVAKSNGKDRLGNPYDLGEYPRRAADVSTATKAAYPEESRSRAFWTQ